MGESDLLLGPHESDIGGVGAIGAPPAPYGPLCPYPVALPPKPAQRRGPL
jgi:hypothetical protein